MIPEAAAAILSELVELKKLQETKIPALSRMEEIKQYILQHSTENSLTATSIAAHFQMSNSYLSRAFKEHTGVNILEYIQGRCNGGRGTFGYTLDSERKFHIDPLTSPFVLESFKKYNEGSTMKEIRDWLNENGIKNPVGGAFTYNSVEHMLKNRRYIGELKFRDVVVPDAIPPIISLELFEDVQEKIAKNKKAPARMICYP